MRCIGDDVCVCVWEGCIDLHGMVGHCGPSVDKHCGGGGGYTCMARLATVVPITEQYSFTPSESMRLPAHTHI